MICSSLFLNSIYIYILRLVGWWIPLGFGGSRSQPRNLKELTVRLFRRLVGLPRVGCSATRLVSVRGKAASFVCLSVCWFFCFGFV